MLGSMFSQSKDKPKYLTRDEQVRIRKTFNKDKVCDKCLAEYKHQGVDGSMLCEECYKERNDVQ